MAGLRRAYRRSARLNRKAQNVIKGHREKVLQVRVPGDRSTNASRDACRKRISDRLHSRRTEYSDFRFEGHVSAIGLAEAAPNAPLNISRGKLAQ
jgi:hypothetical protein